MGWLFAVVAVAAPAEAPTIPLVQALSAAEQAHGSGAPELLPILASLARLRFEQAEVAAATDLRRRALKIAIGAFGSGSVQAAVAMAELAHLYVEQHRYLDAEPLVIAASEILRNQFEPPNPALVQALADRARIALARGKKDRARRWAESAVAIAARDGGAAKSISLPVLGAVLAAQEKFDDAERVLRQALALDRARGDGFATARTLARLADSYLRQKRFSEALRQIEEAILIDQDQLGANHPLMAEDFHELGLIYLAADRPADAEKALQTSVRLLGRGPGRGSAALGYAMLDLARAMHSLGHDDKAEKLFAAAHRILNAAEDEEHDRQRRA